MVSQQDLLAVRQSIPRYSGQLAVIPNGVDLETRRPGLAEPVADTIVFNGSLAYQANLEGFQFFYFQVLPLIWNARANVKIIVTGSLNNVNLDWLTPDPRIVLTGYLDDARCSVASSWISIAPLLDGGGTRLKILEAMALGTPVIATTKGAEGLEIVPGEHLLIENEPEAFASACIRLLGTPGLRRRLTERAHRLVEAKYGWQQIGHRFRDMVEETALCKVGNN
jgi:glycosyltransferase involved in cell wall biosynthesis